MNVKDKLAGGTPLKCLIYGYGKTRKTSWAGSVAKTQMNGIYCDCDNSIPVLGSVLSLEEQARLNYVDISDELNSAKASWFIAALAKGKPFIWDEVDRKVCKARPQATHDCILINPSLFTASDLLIIDSYTQVVNSLFIQYALENNIDLAEANKLEWDDYRWAGQLATYLLTSLMALKCSVVLISHVKTYEKKRKDKFGKEELLGYRTQPISVSNAHAETISKYFGEVYYFYKQGTGTKISTKTTDSLDCGSRFLEPKDWNYDELSLEMIANKYNINRPTELRALRSAPSDLSDSEFDKLWTEVRQGQPSQSSPSATSSSSSSSVIKPNPLLMKK